MKLAGPIPDPSVRFRFFILPFLSNLKIMNILQIAGYDITTIQHGLIIEKNMVIMQSLHVAWPGYANLPQGGESI
jgi:hypothetical protein